MKPLILVVDDDPMLREIVKARLEPAGYNVLMASTGADALAVLASCKPDAMILDLSMPRMSGIQVMQKMNAEPRIAQPPVLVLTTSAAGVDVQAAMAAGASSYLLKPFTAVDLIARLQVMLTPPRPAMWVDDFAARAAR